MPSAKRVLLVDGDPVLRASLAEQLAKEGPYEIAAAGSIAEARGMLDASCAFAIIDQTLPDGSGESFARELRGNGFAPPILLLVDGRERARRLGRTHRQTVPLFRVAGAAERPSWPSFRQGKRSGADWALSFPPRGKIVDG